MLSLNPTQTAIVAATVKKVSWLFDIDLTNDGIVDYYWGLEAKTWATHPYVFKIISFTPIQFKKGSPEAGVLPHSQLTIQVSNANNTLTPSTFVGAGITVRLIMNKSSGIIEAGNCLLINRNGMNYPGVYQAITCENGASYRVSCYGKQKEEIAEAMWISRGSTPGAVSYTHLTLPTNREV